VKSSFFFGLSFVCVVVLGLLLWQRQFGNPLNFNAIPKVATVTTNLTVKSISIPSLNIDLPIIPATITAKVWGTTSSGVSYLSTSPVPGEVGNSIMYGHNWPSLLGRLTNIKTGQEIKVKMADGRVRRFVVQYTATVSPDQSEVLQPTADRRLTIYTCTGFWDDKRFVAVAFPAV